MTTASDNVADVEEILEEEPLAEGQGVLFEGFLDAEELDETRSERADDEEEPRFQITFRKDLPTSYLMILLVASAALLLSASLGLLSWLVPIIVVLSLGATLFEGGSKVALAGGVVLVVVVLLGLFQGSDGPVQPARDRVEVASVLDAPAPDSLSIFLPDLAEQWNVVDAPPQIAKGFTRYAESGEYDSFLYRFGDWGRLAGAYDPSTDAVYALLATGQFSNEATSRLALHLCFVLHPYSSECLDAYADQGLDHGDLDDFIGVTHAAEWMLDDQTWRLDIEGNVLTIRVLAPEVD